MPCICVVACCIPFSDHSDLFMFSVVVLYSTDILTIYSIHLHSFVVYWCYFVIHSFILIIIVCCYGGGIDLTLPFDIDYITVLVFIILHCFVVPHCCYYLLFDSWNVVLVVVRFHYLFCITALFICWIVVYIPVNLLLFWLVFVVHSLLFLPLLMLLGTCHLLLLMHLLLTGVWKWRYLMWWLLLLFVVHCYSVVLRWYHIVPRCDLHCYSDYDR